MDRSPLLEGVSSGSFKRIIMARIPIGVDLLEAIYEVVKREKIQKGLILMGLGALKKAIFRNLTADEIFPLCDEELAKLGPMIDANVDSETYKHILDALERRTNVFLGGRGTASEIVKMTGVRLFHIKSFLGDNVYTARGVNTPRPRAGDLEVTICGTRQCTFWRTEGP